MDENVSSRRPGHRTRRGHLMVGVAGVLLLLVAACGGGGKKATGGNSPGGKITVQALDKFAACMRHNGVPNFYFAPSGSTASATELSLRGHLVPGVSPKTPNFASAMKACNSVDPVGPPPPASRQQFESALHFAGCMRTHGFPTYPDPTLVNGRLTEQPLPSSIDQNSPQFTKASNTCSAT